MNDTRITILAGSFLLLVSFIVSMNAQDSKDQMDYSQFALKMGRTYTVQNITDKQYKLTPKEGYQLVVVELQGTAPKAMGINLYPKDFTAQSVEDTTVSSAVGIDLKELAEDLGIDKDIIGNSLWAMSGTSKNEGTVNGTATWHKQKPGPFTFIIGFMLKKSINHFELNYNKCNAGPVEVQSQTDSPK
jgi:hypothetical protein